MKPRFSYFFWLLFLAFSLMILVVAAQVLTRSNINGLKSGNKDAVITFTINNKLQELVNLSFELNSKITGKSSEPQKRQSLLDSLTMLGYNATVFESMTLNSDTDSAFSKLNTFVSMQVETSLKILNNSVVWQNDGLESFRKLRITDSIYFTALNIQKTLESDLQTTLSNNSKASDSLSDYNRTLAFIAIAAVFIFSAIIINRNLKQVQLISDLEVATKAARENARVKDQFLANMSHEIRTPLNAIKGFGRLLSLTSLDKEQQQYSSIINDATNNLINIVNDILDISKIEAGKLRVEKKNFNIKRVLQAVTHLFKNAASEKKIELTYHIDEDVPVMLSGDPERLSQILINLVSNSIKFTSEGFVKIELSVDRIDNDTTFLKYKVSDSGIGIPKDKLNVIFGRFEQLDTGKEFLAKGTGLGLTIVQSLVSLMDGTVSVTSDVGKGACFVVALPFEKGQDVGEESSTLIASAFQPEKKYSGSTVLLVEDNRVNQVLIRHLLEEYDIKADVVSNGKEAVDAIMACDYDLIFMDIQMPVMDGYTSAKIIRNEMKNYQPIIAMTAYALPGEKEKCLSSGMNDYLAKPIDNIEMDKLLSRYLKESDISKNRELKNSGTEISSYLLQLAGGDLSIARIIINEILNEIPDTKRKLNAILEKGDYDSLSAVNHHMISTFAPLGENTGIMKKINAIRNAKGSDSESLKIIEQVQGLMSELDSIESYLSEGYMQR